MPFNLKLILLATMTFLISFTGAATEDDTPAPEYGEFSLSDIPSAFADTIPSLENGFIDPTPANRKDGISVGKLDLNSDQKNRIVALAKEINAGEHGRFDSLLIAHKGKLVFESYYLRGRIDLPHPQASTTKSYVNLAIGRAIQLGYLTMADLDRPVISFLKDLDTSTFVAGADKITLHHAMTMHSGVRIDNDKLKELNRKPTQLSGLGQVNAYLTHSAPITSDSQRYLYQSIDPRLVMQVLNAVVPQGAQHFIKHELLGKMGITVYGWKDGVSGLPEGAHSSSMRSRDMIKWGILAMNKGKWNGEQLIPDAFVTKSINTIIRRGVEDIFFIDGNVSNPGYGYYWWQADMTAGNKTYLSHSAQGGGGQYIILINELDLIVVATAHDRDASSMQITADRILPAFIQNQKVQ